MMRDRRKLDAWIVAREVAVGVRWLTEGRPKGDELVSQMRRASISIVSNIAEGAAHRSEKQYLRFLEIAGASAGELQAQLELSLGFGFPETSVRSLLDKTGRVKAMIYALGSTIRGDERTE